MSQVNQHISQLREDFMKGQLSEEAMEASPDIQFETWFREAIAAKVNEVQAFNLCTVNADHKPSSRIVYLREFGDHLFYFYTNYQSRKAIDITHNNQVALTFFWPELERQIRIEGTVQLADPGKSDDYFKARPAESKIGAWSSPQSQVIKGRPVLEGFVNEHTSRFAGKDIPRPDFWGGYMITANYYEFWQGRKSRLHDRISYHKQDGVWKIQRLAP